MNKQPTAYQQKIVTSLENAIEDLRDNGETHIEVTVSKANGRTAISRHSIRTSQAKLDLTPQQRQAETDIMQGYQALEQGYGYALVGFKKPNLTGVRGGGLNEDVIEIAKKKIGNLHTWQFDTPRKFVCTVEAMTIHGQTARSFARLTGFDNETISEWYKSGLDSFIELIYRTKREKNRNK